MDNVELELCEEIDKEEIFYRYRCGAYTICFSQYQDNGKKTYNQNCMGCIFQVHVREDSSDYLPLYINEVLGRNLGYPDSFEIENIPHHIDISDYYKFLDKLDYASEHLQIIKDFFFNSKHYELFKERSKLK